MEEILTITRTKCSFCTAKNHCAACGEELSAALTEKPGVLSAEVDIPEKILRIEHSMDRDMLEDMLDGMGLMVD